MQRCLGGGMLPMKGPRVACSTASSMLLTRRSAAARHLRAIHTGASTSELGLVEESSATNWRSPLRMPVPGGDTLVTCVPGSTGDQSQSCVVALGKFDAMHLGHRSLVEKAASMGGQPWLISFSGMAAELGWQQRLPLVALRSRPAILRSWGPACGGVVPQLRCVPFAAVRQLSPRDFVTALARDLKASGVVVGCNYRFGHKAAGTAETLQELGSELGLDVAVLDLMGDDSNADGNVSSSEIRKALAAGQMDLVAQWLGRPYCLVAQHAEHPQPSQCNESRRICHQHFENQQPGAGIYFATISPAAPQLCLDAAGGNAVAITVDVGSDGGAQLQLQQSGEWPVWITTTPLNLNFE